MVSIFVKNGMIAVYNDKEQFTYVIYAKIVLNFPM